jgi:hypothetical protein
LVDAEHQASNDFLLASQLSVTDALYTCRPGSPSFVVHDAAASRMRFRTPMNSLEQGRPLHRQQWVHLRPIHFDVEVVSRGINTAGAVCCAGGAARLMQSTLPRIPLPA